MRKPWFDGYWLRIDTGAWIAGKDQLTLLRIDSDRMEATVVAVVPEERRPIT